MFSMKKDYTLKIMPSMKIAKIYKKNKQMFECYVVP